MRIGSVTFWPVLLLALWPVVVGCAFGPPIEAPLLERSAQHVPLAPGNISLRWLGTAGFIVRTPADVVVIDPYLTRASALRIGFGRLVPEEDIIARAVPRADAVLVGHSHFDHALDAPSIARRTRSPLFGTATTCYLAQRLAPSAQCHVIDPARPYRVGQTDLRFVVSQHVEAPLIGVPIPGELDRAPDTDQAPHALEMPMGGAIISVLRTEGLTVVHLSSSALPESPDALPTAVPEGADVVLASAAVHTQFPDYAQRLVAELRPRLVIPHHFESFITPLPADLDADDREGGESFIQRIEEQGVKAHLPVPFEEFVINDAALPSRTAGPVGATPER